MKATLLAQSKAKAHYCTVVPVISKMEGFRGHRCMAGEEWVVLAGCGLIMNGISTDVTCIG